jgi:hypothetical protein
MSAVEIQNIKMKTVTHVYALMCYPCLCPVPTPALSPPSSLRFDAIAPKPKAKADGRGGIVRRVLSNALSSVVVRLTSNGMESVTVTKFEKLSGNVTARSLSPGEKGRGEGGRKLQFH